LVIIFGHIIFGVPLRGNLLYLFFAMLLYIYSSVSIGVFVSVVADNQLLAFLMVVIISVLPSMLLSGFIFPIESMPLLIQLITNLTPAKFFLSIIRGLLLKGIGIQFIWMNFLYLFVYGSIFMLLSFVAYRKSFKLEL
jgi:ABC-2 type transport system permease protein